MVELISGFPLFLQQYKALLKKNFILIRRSKRSAFFQLFTSLIVFLLIFSTDKYFKKKSDDLNKAILKRAATSPQEFPIPSCDQPFLLRMPCYDFVWSGDGSPEIEEAVKRIMRNNPGRPIPEDRVKSFHTPNDVDAWVFSNLKRTVGALHFVKRNNTIISYGIQLDKNLQRRSGFDVTFLDLTVAFVLAVERENARSILEDSDFSWTSGIKEFESIILPYQSLLNGMGPTVFMAITMFGFIFQATALVTERELMLRQAMSMMGLYESAYWLSWLTWEAVLVFTSSLLTILFGMMFRFDFFRFNSFAVLFLVFYLFSLSMVAFAFTLSNFVRNARSSVTVGFAIFIVSIFVNGVDLYGFPMKKLYRLLMSLFPPILFARALKLLNAAVDPENNPRGISWSKRGSCAVAECHWTIDYVLKGFVSVFFLWIFVAIYLDNIIPNSNGVRKSVWYFLKPSYWTGNGSDKIEEGSIFSLIGALPEVEAVTPDDDDVLAEETAVKKQAHGNVLDPNIAVQIHGLAKVYPGSIRIGRMKLVRNGAFQAVKGLWINIPKNQLFCLLGPNGAGKTTAISCLTGITPVTGGDALIYGNSVRNSVGMSNIRKIIGVCPQFDRLWDALSGREHLHLFSNIKGLPPLTIESETEKSLEQVKLTSTAEVRSSSYSGGMKRRLSVAIALIGDPKLVFLDEPTTGMDPISRRQVWNIIEDAKKGRAIVLTTHSMEEADILSDRIGIMARGRLRCLGTSIRLKSKFGSGYVATVSFRGSADDEGAVSEDQSEHVKRFFKDQLDVKPTEENKKYATFVIPNEKKPLLMKFFTELQEREEELRISDIQLGFTSLEEVFLKIAKQAELENAAGEGASLSLVTLPNGEQIQVPKGARFVGIPNTESPQHPRGLMVEVYWEQAEDGALTLSGCSDECPIPESAQPTTKPLASAPDGIPIGFAVNLEHL